MSQMTGKTSLPTPGPPPGQGDPWPCLQGGAYTQLWVAVGLIALDTFFNWTLKNALFTQKRLLLQFAHKDLRKVNPLLSALLCSWLLGILLLGRIIFTFIYFICPCIWRVWAAPRMLGRGIFWGIKCSRSNVSVPASECTVLPAQGQGPGWALGSLLEAPSEGFPQKDMGSRGLRKLCRSVGQFTTPPQLFTLRVFFAK